MIRLANVVFLLLVFVICCCPALPVTAEVFLRNDCKIVPGPIGKSPSKDALAVSEFRLSARDIAAGYRRASGGCTQVGSDGTIIEGYFHENGPTDGDGWRCSVGRQPGWPDQPKGGPLFEVESQIVACRIVAEPSLMGAHARWSTPASSLTAMVARFGGDITAEIPYSFRICHTDGADVATVRYRVHESGQVDSAKLKLGQCMEIDRPTILAVNNYVVTTRAVAGSYQVLRAGTFDRDPQFSPVRAVDSNVSLSRGIPEPQPIVAECKALDQPLAGYWGACEIPLTNLAPNFRVCFADGYSDQPPGELEYTGSLLPIILDSKLLNADIGNDELRKNPILAGGCRDLFNVSSAYILVAPALPGNPPWIPTKLHHIKMLVQNLDLN